VLLASIAAPFEAAPTVQQWLALPHEIASKLSNPAGIDPGLQLLPPSVVTTTPGAPVAVDPTIQH
jgi:hypothetical protein